VCTRGSDRAPACGPSTSPLDAMLRQLAALLLASVASATFAGPWTPYSADEEKRAAVLPETYKAIDFLTPSVLPDAEARGACVVTFDAFPSFFQDEHWCLLQSGQRYLVKAWKSAGSSPDGKHASAEHRQAELPADIVVLVREIWLNAILEAHYPRLYIAGLDGTIFYFGAKRSDSELLGAQAWSPEADSPPLWITNAGVEVLKYALATSADVDALRRDLLATRNRLFAHYSEHGRQ